MYSEKRSEKLKENKFSLYTTRKTCRICKSKDLITFLKFGDMPLAGGFIKKADLQREKMYPLTVVFCQQCKETHYN